VEGRANLIASASLAPEKRRAEVDARPAAEERVDQRLSEVIATVPAPRIAPGFEPVGRGLYAGTVGYFGQGGDMDQAITIRTLVFRDGEFSFQAGAGIVADSVPDKEYDEVLAKSAILRRALSLAGEGL
ncbi:MAG: chorismate-binding protein, partial [Pseudomonadota bacterium]